MDIELVIRARNGDQGAFTALVDAIGGRLHAVAYGILRDRELARDASQQTLLAAWRDLPSLRDPERFEAWILRILVRACRTEARHAARWMPGLSGLAATEPVAPDELHPVIDRDQLARGFRRLSVDQRVVLVLTYFADLPTASVAAAMGVPVGTAHSRLHRALRALRAALDADARAPAARITSTVQPTPEIAPGVTLTASSNSHRPRSPEAGP